MPERQWRKDNIRPMIEIILFALLPVLVTLGLGMLAGWHRDENVSAAQSLNRMVLVYALPLLLFAGTITLPRAELISDWPLLLTLLVGTAVPYLAAYGIARYLFKRDTQAAALQAMVFGMPAAAFYGVAILTPLIHSKAIVVVDFVGLTANLVILPLTLVLLSYGQISKAAGGGDKQQTKPGSETKPCSGKQSASVWKTVSSALKQSFTQPVVLAPLLAITLVLLNVHLPAIVPTVFKLLGSTVAGIALFASGIILQSQKLVFSLPAAISTVGRLLLIPGLAYLGLTWMGQDRSLIKTTVLALGIAAAPMQVILATKYKANETENAAVLLYTNLISVPTLALFIWLTR